MNRVVFFKRENDSIVNCHGLCMLEWRKWYPGTILW